MVVESRADLYAQIGRLAAENADLRATNTELRAANAELQAANTELRSTLEKLTRRILSLESAANKPAKNSRNSHRPPSSDGLDRTREKRNKKEPSGRKAGGQPGHPFRKRPALPPTERQVVRPTECQHCSSCLMKGRKVGEKVFQRIDIPEISISVIDFVCETVVCPSCEKKTTGKTQHSGRGSFVGPRLAAIMSTLSGRYHLSKRQVQEMLTSILGIDIGLGSVTNVEQRVSQAIAPACEQATLSVQNASVVHADETGWFETAGRSWLWVAATANLAVFRVSGSRGADAARRLLSDDFSGILITDRWGAYNWIPEENRQFCWAHLLRDFTGWEESGGRGASYGGRLYSLGQETIHLWNAERGIPGTSSPPDTRIAENQAAVHDLLKRAIYYGGPEIRRTSQRLLSQENCLWLFLSEPDVVPTNNHAERMIRQAVLWRRKSHGTWSGLGSVFVSRILTTITSLRLQSRDFLEFIADAVTSYERAELSPSLLPQTLALASA